MPYVEFQKGSKKRRVFSPSKRYKSYLRKLLPSLHILQEVMEDPDNHCKVKMIHGFMTGRSALTNALEHVGNFSFTLSMDFKDFFPNVTFFKVMRSWNQFCEEFEMPDRIDNPPEVLTSCVYIDTKTGAPVRSSLMKKWRELEPERWQQLVAEQGLPTSPALSNIAMYGFDSFVEAEIRSTRGGVYTRYADDVTISCQFSSTSPTDISNIVRDAAGKFFYTLNEKKTKLQLASAGRRVITGYAVDDKGAYPTRKVRRKLRAAKHNGWTQKTQGLSSFCNLTLPKPRDAKSTRAYDMATKLLRWGIDPDAVLSRFQNVRATILDTIDSVKSLENADEKVNRVYLDDVESAIAACEIAKKF